MPTRLTASQENYLEQILRIGRNSPVRIRDIAEAAGVALPSASRAIAKLVKAGLVRHEAYGRVEATEKGLKAAWDVARRDECLSRLLVDLLGMPRWRAAAEVCRLEHAVGASVLDRLEALVEVALGPESGKWRERLAGALARLPERPPDDGEVHVGADDPHVKAGQGRARPKAR